MLEEMGVTVPGYSSSCGVDVCHPSCEKVSGGRWLFNFLCSIPSLEYINMPSRSRSRGGNFRMVADDDSSLSTSSTDDAAGIHLLLQCSNSNSYKYKTPSTNNNTKNNTKSSNYKGVYWFKRDSVYHSTIADGRRVYLGSYKLEVIIIYDMMYLFELNWYAEFVLI